MAERKDKAKGAADASTDDVNASMLQEAMADFIKSKMVRIQGADHFMKIISTGVFNDPKPFFPEEDLSYSDVSDYDDDEDDYFQQQKAAHQSKESQTTKSTDEKDDKDGMKAQEERSKEKKQKNKRKKIRRKEKKQSEKENTIILSEEEPGKSDSSENPEENPSTYNNTEANKSPECDKTQNETEDAGDEERSVVNNREESLATINKKEEVEEDEKELDSNNSHAVQSVPEETCNQKPSQEMQRISQLVEVLQLEEEEPKVVEEKPKVVEEKPKVVEEKPKVVENPEVPKEKRNEPNEEQLQKENVQQKTTDTAAEEYAKISRELAGTGNRLAASGMFEKAIECFTDAIKFNPREYRLFGNRSLCYERMQQFENALRDADLSLSMEPNWIKGLFRKGKALCGLKRYYEAFLVYDKVLQLDGSSAEAKQESKRAQTLYLMEQGYSWAESNEALKNHATLGAAASALHDAHNPSPGTGFSRYDTDARWLQAEDGKEGQANHSGAQRLKVPARTSSPLQNRSQSHSPTPRPRNYVKPQLYSIWVGALAPTVTYDSLHELFSRGWGLKGSGSMCDFPSKAKAAVWARKSASSGGPPAARGRTAPSVTSQTTRTSTVRNSTVDWDHSTTCRKSNVILGGGGSRDNQMKEKKMCLDFNILLYQHDGRHRRECAFYINTPQAMGVPLPFYQGLFVLLSVLRFCSITQSFLNCIC